MCRFTKLCLRTFYVRLSRIFHRRSGSAGTLRGRSMSEPKKSTSTAPLRDALNFAQRQVRNLIENHPGFYPLYTDHGKWKHDKPAWTRWCDGFLPGMMWLFLESGL